MKIRFLGATDGHVTGSCTHFSYDRKNTQFLVDCGLVQGEGNDEADNGRPFPFSPCEIKFVLLTHAHLDHCGLLPKLYREGFTGRVICTKATARLTLISLMDSVRHVKGLYSEEDVKRVRFDYIDERSDFGLSRMLPISDDLFASFSRSAHVLGACSIVLGWINEANEKVYIVMSGDLGNNTKENPFQPLLAGRQGIFGWPEAIVVESTYGGRVREKHFSDFDARIEVLREIVQREVFDKKSVLVVPAFSLQRTQELLFDLQFVFSKYFSAPDQCQSPFYPKNPWVNDFDGMSWGYQLNGALSDAIALLEPNCAAQWTEEIVKSAEPGKALWSFKEGAKHSIDDIQKLISNSHTYPVDIVLDSALGREMSGVFRDELCRRQKKYPEKTVYRNRKMAERLGLKSEEEVDEFIQTLFPVANLEAVKIPVGIHEFRYETAFKTPRFGETQKRGCIVITGGGMCEGGPVVKHLEKLVASRRQATVLVTGYMAKGTLGERLISICKARDQGKPLPSEDLVIGEKTITPTEVTLKAIEIQGYYSGHADQEGVLDFVFRERGEVKEGVTRKAATIFLNHGQHAARKELKEAIQSRGEARQEGDRVVCGIELPDNSGFWYDLNTKQWLEPEKESKTDSLLRELLLEQRKTNQLLQRLVEHRGPLQNSAPKKPGKALKK
ncbi:MBL fold metallo-hydrolase [Aeromonas dhakensis]|uniref:MBL fold metallo-hydrolase n=1 Tax=Aeromonas dhakensis TaxID=196024 RepID=UPI0038D16314